MFSIYALFIYIYTYKKMCELFCIIFQDYFEINIYLLCYLGT